MNPADLAALCVQNINFATEHKLPFEDTRITIVTPKGWKAPPRFPRGEILQAKEDGSRVRSLPAANVLAWLSANKLIKLKMKVKQA